MGKIYGYFLIYEDRFGEQTRGARIYYELDYKNPEAMRFHIKSKKDLLEGFTLQNVVLDKRKGKLLKKFLDTQTGFSERSKEAEKLQEEYEEIKKDKLFDY